MSLRVKIPGRRSAVKPSVQSTTDSAPLKRKISKRRLIQSESEDYDEAETSARQESQAASSSRAGSRSKRLRTEELKEEDSQVPLTPGVVDMDLEIQVEDEFVDVEEAPGFTNFPPRSPPSPAKPSSSKKSRHDSRRSKKSILIKIEKNKRQVIYSDEDNGDGEWAGDEEDEPMLDAGEIAASDGDEDFEPEQPVKRAGGTTKHQVLGKGKVGSSSGPKGTGTKGKASKEKKEIFIRDERKFLPSTQDEEGGHGGKGGGSVKKEDGDKEDTGGATQPATSADADDQSEKAPVEPKKRKLPTIKKNKSLASTTTTSHSSQPSQGPKPPPLDTKPVEDIGQLTTPKNVARTPAAMLGSVDFDLRNKTVYAELFKDQTGGNTPRSSSNRRDKDEQRRKELDQMRDEARAKRLEEAKRTFDLQGQAEKIARYEERLREENSLLLHPNYLAARFRDDYEKEKRRSQRPKEQDLNRPKVKEEGEA